MDGVHDVGGMHGFGAVPTDDDAAFHSDLDRRIFGITRFPRLHGVHDIHEYRHAIERMEPADYYGATYWERFLAGIERLLIEKDVLTEAEIDRRTEAFERGDATVPERSDPALVEEVLAAFEADKYRRIEADDPRFDAGDEVLVANRHPEGHTRCPRYVRRVEGTVRKVLGAFPVPDAAVEGEEAIEPVYSVAFDADDVWGEEYTDADRVYVDQWERYLREADDR